MSFLSNVNTRLGISATSLTSAQLGADAFQANFSAQATHGNTLTAMTAASFAFSLGRTLSGGLLSQVLGGNLLRAAAWMTGFTSEVLAFRGVNQVLNPGSESWLNSSGLLSTATDFLLLKGAGVLCGPSSAVVRQAVQATAMVGGEYAGEAMSVREHSGQAFSERFAHALATGVALDVGGHLVNLGTAGRITTVQRNLEQQALRQAQPAEGQSNLSENALSQMAAQRKGSSDSLVALIRDAAESNGSASEVLDRVRNSSDEFRREHLGAMIEVANSRAELMTALEYLAIRCPNLFETQHVDAIIAGASVNPLSHLVSKRPGLFTRQHLTDMLALPISTPAAVANNTARRIERIAEALQKKHGWKFFTRDHVRGLIALAGTHQETPTLLDGLTKERPNLFQPEDLPALAEAYARNYRVLNSFERIFRRTHEAKALSWDLFMAILEVDEAHRTQAISDRSALPSFARENFNYFTPERLNAIIEAAKTHRVAAEVLHELVGRVDADSWKIDPTHPRLSSRHVPGIIEAAISQEPAADALAALADWRRDPLLVTAEHYPAIIAAAGENPRVGKALLPLVSNRSIKVTFTREHLSQMLAVARASEPVVQAIHGLVVSRPDLAGAVTVADVLTLAQAHPNTLGLLRYFVQDRPRAFGVDHVPSLLEVARANPAAIPEILNLFRSRPDLLRPETLAQMVEIHSALSGREGDQQQSAFLRFCSERNPYFTAEYVQPLVALASTHPLALTLLYQMTERHPEFMTREHLQSLLDVAKANASLHMIICLRHFLMENPDLYQADDFPVLFQLAVQKTDLLACAALLGSLVDHPTMLASFSGENVPALMTAAETNSHNSMIKNLSRLVSARSDLFDSANMIRLLEIAARRLR